MATSNNKRSSSCDNIVYASTGMRESNNNNTRSVYREVYGDVLHSSINLQPASIPSPSTAIDDHSIFYDPTPPATPAPNNTTNSRYFNNQNNVSNSNSNSNNHSNSSYNHSNTVTGLDAFVRDNNNNINRTTTTTSSSSSSSSSGIGETGTTIPAPPMGESPRKSSKWRINVFGNAAAGRKFKR